MRYLIALLIPLSLIFFQSNSVSSAEILQIRGSTLLQIGDHNRTYTVKLVCVDVPSVNEKEATTWLRRQLPRTKRVNLYPQGVEGGILLARVGLIEGWQDLSKEMSENGLAKYTCN